ncbi:STAS domain-containing protein [Jatrophihabitans sp.]|uniref:STAS domain-containing protein n=1 Tax=Jatrophihabitans sp. TaxID=1932789 RepID=UPI0030C69C88|nr:anti-anti-sigma factor [Jatrophihabitans sp.]
MQLSVSRLDPSGVALATVDGEIDVYSAPTLRDGLTELLQQGASVVVDLTEVGFLDSTGLGALVAARKVAEDSGAQLPLVCTRERILKLFTITGLDGVFTIHPSIDGAVAALATGGTA